MMKIRQYIVFCLAIILALGLANAMDEIPDDLEEQVTMVMASTLDGCVETLQTEFPNANQMRLKTACATRFGFENVDAMRKKVTTTESRTMLTAVQKQKLAAVVTKTATRLRSLNEERQAKLADLDGETLKKATLLTRAELKRVSEKVVTKEMIEMKIRERKELETKVQQVREIAKKRLSEIKEKIKTRVEATKRLQEKHQEAKDKLKELSPKIRECKDSETEECEAFKKEVKTHSKEYMLKHIDMLINKLEDAKDKLEGTNNVDSADLSTRVTAINELIEEAKALKTTVEAYNDETTAEEYRNAATKLKEIWSKVKNALYRHTLHLVHKKVGLVIVSANHMEERLENYLEKMEGKGVDVSTVEELVEKYSDLIQEAKDFYDEGMTLFKEAQEAKDSEKYKLANEKFRSAHSKLQEAQKVFVEIKKALNENGEEYEEKTEEEKVETEEEEEETGPECSEETPCDEGYTCNNNGECEETEEEETEEVETEEEENDVCAAAGVAIRPDMEPSQCCEGLDALVPVCMTNGECNVNDETCAGATTCADCGNGICADYENKCTCPDDCNTSQNNDNEETGA